jgi:RHS repeat-associated protein
MYTGKPYDSATGLYYYGARYYDHLLGRFLTQDSHTGSLNDPMTLNLYIYGRDNPLKYTDPTGQDWWNPLTWTPQQQSQAIVVGLAVATVVASFSAPPQPRLCLLPHLPRELTSTVKETKLLPKARQWSQLSQPLLRRESVSYQLH